jgi:hypothetical protein
MVPGGVIIIRDFFLEEDRTTPPQASLFAINMLVGTSGGDCYTESEVTDLLQKAGFQRASFSRVSNDSAILTAYKP